MKIKLLLISIIMFFSSNGYTQETGFGKFTGQVFADYFYNIARDTAFSSFKNVAVDGLQDINGFALRRAALNYDVDISEKFMARFRLEADSKANTTNGRIGVFVKDAYIKWKNIFTGSDLIFGIQPTASFEVSEKYWGYRSLEKTVQDLRGFVASRDFAIVLRGKLVESGNANYSVMFGSNSANNPETDKYNRYYAAFDFKPFSNFSVSVTGDFKARASVADPNNAGATLPHNSILGSIFLGYGEKNKYSFGVEGALQSNQNSSTVSGTNVPELKSLNALGISVFGSYWITETLAALLRYDYFDANMDGDIKGDSRNYFITGIDFKADKNISIIPNVIYESYESLPDGRSFDSSVTGRLTLYYNF